MIPLTFRTNKFIEREIRGFQGLERGRSWELLLNGYRVSIWNDENFWKQIMVMVAQQCECK